MRIVTDILLLESAVDFSSASWRVSEISLAPEGAVLSSVIPETAVLLSVVPETAVLSSTVCWSSLASSLRAADCSNAANL